MARFDLDLVARAVLVNRPTDIALHGTDYIDFINKGKTKFETLTANTKEFFDHLEKQLGTPVSLIGTGPSDTELIDRTSSNIVSTALQTRELEAQNV